MSLNLHWIGQRPIFVYPCHWTVLERAVRRLIVEALVVGMIESLDDNVSVGHSRRSAASEAANEKRKELITWSLLRSLFWGHFPNCSVTRGCGETSLKWWVRLMML